MTTSGVTEWSLTARDIGMKAMGELSILESGGEPTSEELTDIVLSLNGMLKSWQVHDGLWREDDATATFPAATATITLDDGIKSVLAARLSVSATYERPLQMWTRADYNALPNKLQTGTPLALYCKQTTSAATLTVWPVPSVETTVLLDISRGIETITDASQTVDVPQDWQEAVWANLALRIAGGFEAEISGELASRAIALKQALLDNARPDSFFIESVGSGAFYG